MSASQQKLLSSYARLEELMSFRAEYQDKFQQTGMGGMNGATLHSFQQFLKQLDKAIAQQRDSIVQIEQECKIKREQWLQKHSKTSSYEKTVERFKQAENRVSLRREQKELDDYPGKPKP